MPRRVTGRRVTRLMARSGAGCRTRRGFGPSWTAAEARQRAEELNREVAGGEERVRAKEAIEASQRLSQSSRVKGKGKGKHASWRSINVTNTHPSVGMTSFPLFVDKVTH